MPESPVFTNNVRPLSFLYPSEIGIRPTGIGYYLMKFAATSQCGPNEQLGRRTAGRAYAGAPGSFCAAIMRVRFVANFYFPVNYPYAAFCCSVCTVTTTPVGTMFSIAALGTSNRSPATLKALSASLPDAAFGGMPNFIVRCQNPAGGKCEGCNDDTHNKPELMHRNISPSWFC